MDAKQMALVQGWADTRSVLKEWNRHQQAVLGRWILYRAGVAALLLFATWVISLLLVPDSDRLVFPGVNSEATFDDYLYVLFRNGLVLTLHALACVAGFIAGSSLPRIAEG